MANESYKSQQYLNYLLEDSIERIKARIIKDKYNIRVKPNWFENRGPTSKGKIWIIHR